MSAREGFWDRVRTIGCGVLLVLIVLGALAANFLGGRSNPLESKTRYEALTEKPAAQREAERKVEIEERVEALERRVEALERK